MGIWYTSLTYDPLTYEVDTFNASVSDVWENAQTVESEILEIPRFRPISGYPIFKSAKVLSASFPPNFAWPSSLIVLVDEMMLVSLPLNGNSNAVILDPSFSLALSRFLLAITTP